MKFTQKLKSFFQKVAAWFKVNSAKSDELINRYGSIAVDVVNGLKNFNDSPTADVIQDVSTTLLGKYGGAASGIITAVRKWLSKELPQIVDGLKIAVAVSKKQSVNDKLIAAREAIKALGVADKSYVYSELSAKLLVYLADGKIEIKEALQIVKYVYNNYINKVR